jgi:hypothetical protein
MWTTAFRLKQLLVTSAATCREHHLYRKILEVVEEGRAEVCCRKHLDGFRRYAELTDAIERWLEDTRGLAHWRTIL